MLFFLEVQVLTSFYSVFEQKLQQQKESLKEEYAKAKSDRRKEWMKKQIADAKDMRNHLREMKAHMNIVHKTTTQFAGPSAHRRGQVCSHCVIP